MEDIGLGGIGWGIYRILKCPKCERLYQTSLDINTGYCDKCGQKLDWSVEE